MRFPAVIYAVAIAASSAFLAAPAESVGGCGPSDYGGCNVPQPSNGISGLLYIPGVPAVFDRQAGRTDGCGSCVWTSAVLCNSQSDDTTTCDTGGQRVCPIGDQYIEVSFADARPRPRSRRTTAATRPTRRRS